MKPRIFLSHSKADKDFIHQIANDLRGAQIDVWVDEWEIPVGESIRRKIFEEGIPFCDLFFVYLTENSINSYWVQKELDSAVIIEADRKHSFLAVFVEKDSLRSKLSPDLRAMNIPELNKTNYLAPFVKLISKAWSVSGRKNEIALLERNKIQVLEKENEILRLQAENTSLRAAGNEDLAGTLERMKKMKVKIRDIDVSFDLIFNLIKYQIASGTTASQIRDIIDKTYGITREYKSEKNEEYYDLTLITGFLVIQNIVAVEAETDQIVKMYYITEFGAKLAKS